MSTERTRGRVFVVQPQANHSYADAAKFGSQVIRLLDEKAHIMNPARATALLKKTLWDHGFCDDDYLLAVGAPSLIMLAGIIAAGMNGGRVKVLHWDRVKRFYFSVQLEV